MFIRYNEQAIKYSETNDIIIDLVNDAQGNYTMIEVWKNSSTNDLLVEI